MDYQLRRLEQLANQHRSFAFETTLASRSFAPRIATWIRSGYAVHLVFLWLPDVDLALARVRGRARLGGHDVPTDTVRRRYVRGIRNFFGLYRPLVSTWRLYDNANARPRLIARGSGRDRVVVSDRTLWTAIEEAHDAT